MIHLLLYLQLPGMISLEKGEMSRMKTKQNKTSSVSGTWRCWDGVTKANSDHGVKKKKKTSQKGLKSGLVIKLTFSFLQGVCFSLV